MRSLRPASAMLASALLVFGLNFSATQSAKSEPIRGAGSTFAAPVVAKWSESYKKERADGGDFISPDWIVDYELVGSMAGIMRLSQPELDFAASDVPLTSDELAKRGLQQFPFVMGGVAIVVNIDGVAPGALRLNGPVLADIYLGKIQNWSDAAIKSLNPELKLPDQRITVNHRKDGSGTTYVLTDYLSSISAEWKTKYGADLLITWPLGTSSEGSQGLLRAIRSTKGSIGYVEYGQVSRAGLAFAAIQNKAGNFVKPEPAGVQAAASAIDWSKTKDFSTSLADQPGADAYPISAATFAIVPVQGRAASRYRRVHDLFALGFDKGAADASALGYVPLPAPLVEQIKSYWAKAQRAGG
ncbi:PstS ABC-type phosphate transport system, periplasmic component [Rhabdaerophilaceae bacterium]